jgi:hypothetical protein
VWLAARALRAEREHAADDCVLGAGVRASEYASLLLDVARTAPRPLPAPAASFASARRSHLEQRVRSILDPNRPRRPAGRAVALAAVLLATLAVAPLAASRPSSAATAAVVPDVVVELAGDGPPSREPHGPAASARGRRAKPSPAPPAPPDAHAPDGQTRTPRPSPMPSPSPHPSPSIGDDEDGTGAIDVTPAAGDTEVVAALKVALTDDDEGVRRQAAWALRMIRIGKGDFPHARPRVRPRSRVKPEGSNQ